MNPRISSAIAHTETIIAGLRALSALPCAAPFDFSHGECIGNLLQFFPAGHKQSLGHREIAKPFCRALGGTWTVRVDGSWECDRVTFPGLERCSVALHYIEPDRTFPANIVDLSEHPPFSSVEARP